MGVSVLGVCSLLLLLFTQLNGATRTTPCWPGAVTHLVFAFMASTVMSRGRHHRRCRPVFWRRCARRVSATPLLRSTTEDVSHPIPFIGLRGGGIRQHHRRMLRAVVAAKRRRQREKRKRQPTLLTEMHSWSVPRYQPKSIRVDPTRVHVDFDAMCRVCDTVRTGTVRDHRLQRFMHLWHRHADPSFLSRPSAELLRIRSVVYAVFHIPTGGRYIGQTSLTCVDRFKSHMTHRHTEKSTGLSKLMAQSPNPTDFVLLPLVSGDQQQLLFLERNMIGIFRPELNSVSSTRRFRSATHRPPPRFRLPSSVDLSNSGERANRFSRLALHLQSMQSERAEAELERCSLKTLCALRDYVSSDFRYFDFVRNAIEAKRIVLKDADHTEKTSLWLKLAFNNPAMEHAARIAIDSVQWPFKPEDKLRVRVCHVGGPTLAQRIHNFVDLSTCADVSTPQLLHDIASTKEKAPCPCRRFVRPGVNCWNGHVVAPGYKVLQGLKDYETCAHILCHGSKVRWPFSLPRTKLHFQKQLQLFARFMEKRERLTPGASKAWQDKVCAKFGQNVDQKFVATKHRRGSVHSYDHSVAAKFSELHQIFAMLPTDRNAQNVAFACKVHYQQRLAEHFHGVAYVDVSREESDLILRQSKSLAEEMGVLVNEDDENNIPYPYLIPKFHKGKESWRPIVGTSRRFSGRDEYLMKDPAERAVEQKSKPKNYLTNNATLLSRLCRACLDVLKWEDEECDTHRVIATNSVLHVVSDLRDLRNEATVSQHNPTFTQSDMGSMYTSLSQDTVVRNCTFMVHLAFSIAAKRLGSDVSAVKIFLDNRSKKVDQARWSANPDETSRGYNIEDVNKLICFCVKNSLVCCNGQIRRQRAGVGMGVSCSPELATLSCACTEYHKFRTVAEAVHFASRYIDDTIARSGCVLPTAEDYGVDTIITNHELSSPAFLGIQVHGDCVPFEFGPVNKLEDKQKYPDGVVRYPAFRSCIPEASCKGALCGSLVYFYRISSTVDVFLSSSEFLIHEFLHIKQYPEETIRSAVTSFVRRHWTDPKVPRRKILKKLLAFIHTPSTCVQSECGLKGGGRNLRGNPMANSFSSLYAIYEVQCFRCKRYGHKAFECRTPICLNCGRANHRLENCWFSGQVWKYSLTKSIGNAWRWPRQCINCGKPGHDLMHCKVLGQVWQSGSQPHSSDLQSKDPSQGTKVSSTPLQPKPATASRIRPGLPNADNSTCYLGSLFNILELCARFVPQYSVLFGGGSLLANALKQLHSRTSRTHCIQSLRQLRTSLGFRCNSHEDVVDGWTRLQRKLPGSCWTNNMVKSTEKICCSKCNFVEAVQECTDGYWRIPAHANLPSLDTIAFPHKYNNDVPLGQCPFCKRKNSLKYVRAITGVKNVLLVQLMRVNDNGGRINTVCTPSRDIVVGGRHFSLRGVVEQHGSTALAGHFTTVVLGGDRGHDVLLNNDSNPLQIDWSPSWKDYIWVYIAQTPIAANANGTTADSSKGAISGTPLQNDKQAKTPANPKVSLSSNRRRNKRARSATVPNEPQPDVCSKPLDSSQAAASVQINETHTVSVQNDAGLLHAFSENLHSVPVNEMGVVPVRLDPKDKDVVIVIGSEEMSRAYLETNRDMFVLEMSIALQLYKEKISSVVHVIHEAALALKVLTWRSCARLQLLQDSRVPRDMLERAVEYIMTQDSSIIAACRSKPHGFLDFVLPFISQRVPSVSPSPVPLSPEKICSKKRLASRSADRGDVSLPTELMTPISVEDISPNVIAESVRPGACIRVSVTNLTTGETSTENGVCVVVENDTPQMFYESLCRCGPGQFGLMPLPSPGWQVTKIERGKPFGLPRLVRRKLAEEVLKLRKLD